MSTPFFHHVAALVELYQAAQEDRLFTYHFNILRTRLINILSHGNYSLLEPQQMLDGNKPYFQKILMGFLESYPFNPELFPRVANDAVIP